MAQQPLIQAPVYQNATNYTTGTQDTAQQQQQAGAQANQYTEGQQALQGQLPGMYSSLIGGQVPTQFTAPQQLIDQYNRAFQANVAPGLAAQYGAGSPQIASQQSFGLGNLLANQYQQGIGNYQNALGQAAGYALSPVGSSNATQGNQTSQGTQQGTGSIVYNSTPMSLISQILQLLTRGQALTNQPALSAIPTAPPVIPGLGY